MLRVNYLTSLLIIGALWLALSRFLAHDCGAGADSPWAYSLQGLSETQAGQPLSPIEACELSRVHAIAGDSGVRIWTSLPTLLGALVLIHLLRRHLGARSGRR